MAITIAHSKPNIHQPTKKATTDNSPKAPQFIDIAIETHFISSVKPTI